MVNGKVFSTSDYDNMRKMLLNAKYLVGHNIQRFDIPILERLLGIKITAKLIDTLALSWYLYPDRNKHGLEHWGEEFGVPKPKIDDWFGLSTEEYTHRCEEDVKINSFLWRIMYRKLLEIYGDEDSLLRFLDYIEFKMDCARKQEESRWKLDVKKTEKYLIELLEEQKEKTEALSKKMPKVPVRTKKSAPKRPLRKDGTPSKIGQAWLTLLEEQDLPENTEEVEIITDYVEGNPNSHQQIKDWLFDLGWVPETIKYVKKDGKTREIPQINKEIQKGGGICDSIKKLYEKEPSLELLDGLSVLNHRIGILSGFLRDVDQGGYIKAQIQGITNTLRFQHKTIVNLPKTNRPYGQYIREVLIAPSDDYELCGADMTSLEDRLKQSFIYPLDPDYVNSMLSEDYDPHLELAIIAGMLSYEDAEAYKQGDKSKKLIRDIAKNGNYALNRGI